MEYLAILISIFLVCIVAKWKLKLQLFHSSREAMKVFGSLLAIGSAWDTFSIYRGYWSYKQQFFIGLKIGLMPLEEYLFMIVVPFLTLVIYRIVRRNE